MNLGPVPNHQVTNAQSPTQPSSPHNALPYPPPHQYYNRFPPMDPQTLHEHYANAQRFAAHSQQNEPNLSYLQYAYHMNQMNNPLGGGGAGGQPMMSTLMNDGDARGYAKRAGDLHGGHE